MPAASASTVVSAMAMKASGTVTVRRSSTSSDTGVL
jgi:hypothetical protein